VAPGKLPVIGHAKEFRTDPIDFLAELPKLGELVRVYLGPLRTYAVTSPDLVYQMLVTDAAQFEKGRIFDMMRGFFGNGLVTSSGPFHRRQRRLIQPAFNKKMIAEYVDVMRHKAAEMVDSWAAGETIDLQAAADDLALSIGVASLFDAELSDADAEMFKEALRAVLRGLVARVLLPDAVFKLPIPAVRRVNEAERRLRAAVEGIIRARRADSTVRGDLLSELLAARDDDTGLGMTDPQVLDEVVSLILASTETSSSILASLFYRLSEHPEIADRMRAEIDEVVGDGPIEYEHLARLSYTYNVLSEVLRLDMPVDMFMRRSTEEVVMGQTRLPPGSEFIFSIPALHRNPHVFPEPRSFDPDRWVRRPARDLPRGAYIPFGAGFTICIGNSFGLAELAVVAVAVLEKWRLAVVPGERPKRVHRASTHFTSLRMVVQAR
jgi:cytochrome P450